MSILLIDDNEKDNDQKGEINYTNGNDKKVLESINDAINTTSKFNHHNQDLFYQKSQMSFKGSILMNDKRESVDFKIIFHIKQVFPLSLLSCFYFLELITIQC